MPRRKKRASAPQASQQATQQAPTQQQHGGSTAATTATTTAAGSRRVAAPPPAAPQQQRHNRPQSRIPNTRWRSVSARTLRNERRYTALAPVALLPTHVRDNPLLYRYVRQDSMLWGELHDGMLTTGRLKQALGMHEHKAAQVLGIHPGSRGSSHLLSAYFHLLQTSGGGGAAGAGAGAGDAAASQADAAAAERTRRLYNQQLAAAAAAAAAADGTAPQDAPQDAAAAPGLEDLRRACERVAAAGEIAVKLAWGSVQEGAALHSLLQIFPDSLVEEVGLFKVDERQLPSSWGVGPCGAALPPLGASPDGLIVHRLTFPEEDLRAAAEQLRGLAGGSGCSGGGGGGGSGGGRGGGARSRGGKQQQAAAAAAAAAAAGPASEQQVLQRLLAGALGAVACTAPPPPRGVPLASSSDSSSSGSSSSSSAPAGPGSSGSEGDSRPGSSGAESGGGDATDFAAGGPRRLPPDAAGASSATAEGAGGLAFPPVDVALLQLLQPYQQEQQQPAASSSSSSSSRSQTFHVREVVEVKSHSPFAFRSKRKGKKGRVHVDYGFRARGPAQRIHPQWVPQLQMHMLATGCQSALLVSRCAHVGVRVFRVWRDDGYLQELLRLLALLQEQHVAPGVPPRPDTFSAGAPERHRRLLHRTVAIARGAACVAAAGEEVAAAVPPEPDGSNVAKFW